MRLLNFILIIFLILTNGIKADTEFQVLKNLKNGGNLIFIRHAYAPGGGDPDNFDINDCSPVMMRNVNVLDKSLVAVQHIDGTARVQIVKQNCGSLLRQILEEWYDRTGCPMLLNTSLNIKGEPIVNTWEQAEEWSRKYSVAVF